MADTADAIAVAADGLRPQTERAARFASAPRVERQIRVIEVADEIVLDDEVALVNRRDERKLVHVEEDGAIRVVRDAAVGRTIGQPGNAAQLASFGHLLDGEIELVAGDEIDRLGRPQAALRVDGDPGADESDHEARVELLQSTHSRNIGRE
jgi:hypothetical protein